MQRVCDTDIYTFEEALTRFEEVCELYGHLGQVKLIYENGYFCLIYTKPLKDNNNE